ncbi:MAG: PspC domain-containing protein [Ignavibacteria bacterium]|nr:PspC domain-containing protein [Ignavibacteria bacterium]
MEKRLYRSRKYRVFGGVAGGLAEYFNIDPVLMRVIFVVLVLTKGFGILLYIILWIVIPEMPFDIAYNIKTDESKTSDSNSEAPNINFEVKKNSTGRTVFGIILIALGVLFFFDRFIPSFDFDDVFPIALIVIGLFLVYNSTRKLTRQI